MMSNQNTAQPIEISPHAAALVAGLSLLMMVGLAAFAQFYVLEPLVVAQDAQATVNNLRASSGLFRWAISGFVLVVILDVLVAWGLHGVLERVNRSLSTLAVWFRLSYAAVLALALNPLLSVLPLLEAPQSFNGLEANSLNTQVMMSISAFQSGWDLGLVLFGCHLLVLGYLVFKSVEFPRWLGVLLGVAGLGYLVDSFGKFLQPSYDFSIAAFTFVGEFLLIFWLLYMGIKGFANPSTELTAPSRRV